MLVSFSTVDNSVMGGFFDNSEELHYGINNRLSESPYLLCDTKLPFFHVPRILLGKAYRQSHSR